DEEVPAGVRPEEPEGSAAGGGTAAAAARSVGARRVTGFCNGGRKSLADKVFLSRIRGRPRLSAETSAIRDFLGVGERGVDETAEGILPHLPATWPNGPAAQLPAAS